MSKFSTLPPLHLQSKAAKAGVTLFLSPRPLPTWRFQWSSKLMGEQLCWPLPPSSSQKHFDFGQCREAVRNATRFQLPRLINQHCNVDRVELGDKTTKVRPAPQHHVESVVPRQARGPSLLVKKSVKNPTSWSTSTKSPSHTCLNRPGRIQGLQIRLVAILLQEGRKKITQRSGGVCTKQTSQKFRWELNHRQIRRLFACRKQSLSWPDSQRTTTTYCTRSRLWDHRYS